MKISDLLNQQAACFGKGIDSDVVISSRVRLARNIAEYPFVSRLSHQDSRQLIHNLEPSVLESLGDGSGSFAMENLSPIDRQLLVERHLISKDFGMSSLIASVACVAQDESACVMLNEEDHLRIQSMVPGLNLESPLKRCQEIDTFLENKTVYAFNDKFGYLTACPSNVGTGMRASVMLHLPALTLTQQVDKVRHSLEKITLAVRGLFGEGQPTEGDFFQISNQITLGYTEEGLLKELMDVIPSIVAYERKARQYLLDEKRDSIIDRTGRALELLRNTQSIKMTEAMSLLSNVRLGVCLNLLENVELAIIDRLLLQTQPAHVQKLLGGEMDSSERDLVRAKFIRNLLAEKKETSST